LTNQGSISSLRALLLAVNLLVHKGFNEVITIAIHQDPKITIIIKSCFEPLACFGHKDWKCFLAFVEYFDIYPTVSIYRKPSGLVSGILPGDLWFITGLMTVIPEPG
jgi:hypothetical protein